ncbi:ABC-2 family transporter [Asanoa ferruginea]|uniref:ABC-2 family transporter n=1 Tax=Asanoa ferruginea TaxID=53367 RepID=A0A3D9ZWE9_9ACTN|nr:ABC transporter permease subunit [Asanoa ferruginea]REG00863.1 ABC-2 family transporter [Asanoa ferruginea]GIF47262.1 transporter [Asanoa ferruginea]
MTAITRPQPATDLDDDAQTPGGGFRGLLWLTWRQHRWAIIGTLILAAVLVGWMTYLSIEFTNIYHQCHNAMCPDHSPQSNRLAGSSILIRSYSYLSRLVQYMPLLIGVFIGVPLLSREHEQRTLLLAWSQDVSPARWLWAKLSLLGLFVAVVTAAVAATSDHMEHALARVSIGTLFQHERFINTAMLPLVISVCWFAIGVALGAVIRRTLPAVFAVVAGFIGLMLLVQYRYPTLMKPLSFYRQFSGPDDRVLDKDALVVRGGLITFGSGDQPSHLYDASRHPLTSAALERLCPPDNGTGTGTTLSCFADHHLQQYIEYQPGSRIPEFHLIVGAGYLGLAAAAILAVWLIVRRTNLSAG